MIYKEKTIGEIVAENHKAAAVFDSMGIDFCCGGDVAVYHACEVHDIEYETLKRKLEDVMSDGNDIMEFNNWSLDLLVDYIQKKHHGHVEKVIPTIQEHLDKLCRVHGDIHSELFDIASLFNETAKDLTVHIKKEELILFPFIKKLVSAVERKEPIQKPTFGTVHDFINEMHNEHESEGSRLIEIRQRAKDFVPPADACNTFKLTYAELEDFEKDLHMHIHLENNILFPKAKELELQVSFLS